MGIRIISAGAGSGKTYRLTSELVDLLKNGVRPSGIIATTFTNKAAAELQERVRVRLLESGLYDKADEISNALIGTVHSLGVKLLKRFAFEAGVSPDITIMADEDQQTMFNESLAMVLTEEKTRAMEDLCDRLGLNKNPSGTYDWRREVRQLTDVTRINNFSADVLEKSKKRSFESFCQFLDPIDPSTHTDNHQQLKFLLETTIERLQQSGDETKKTKDAIGTLQLILGELELKGLMYWHEWVKVSKLDVAVKSKADIEELIFFAQRHLSDPDFHQDIKAFIDLLFDIASEALMEYDHYKKTRGLIDYTDMEVKINELLNQSEIQEILKTELDLLMVDEFQDTSPIQLQIFLQLSALAGQSIWVGDPKQSIYGFRGAEPQLMHAIIKASGGVKPEDIQMFSWRSREDLVYLTNALFTKVFSDTPVNQVALIPKRNKQATAQSANKESEPIDMLDALVHWHLDYEGLGRKSPKSPWFEQGIAHSLKTSLDNGWTVLPKGGKHYRPAQPGDVAVLCCSNLECQTMAEALAKAGFKVAISRTGLMKTPEAKLILACLKYLLNRSDTLSIAEIMVLAGQKKLNEVAESRLVYLIQKEEGETTGYWGQEDDIIAGLNQIRKQIRDFTISETLNLVLESFNLRAVIASWGQIELRLDNVETLRLLASRYEENCDRLHLAASLAGFLLWLFDLENEGLDFQGAGESDDAVNVMTYHKSKGLEWPIVICGSMEGSLKVKLWGVQLINENEEVDLNNVLGNRWIRYWVNPYGDQFRNTTLDQRLKASDVYAEARQQSLMEDARLLYVGLTRARDFLVMPTRDQPTRWLNRIWHLGDEEAPTLEQNSFESPWEWDQRWIGKHTETFVYPPEFPKYDLEEGPLYFIEPPAGKADHLPVYIDLHKEQLFPDLQMQPGTTEQYTNPWQLAIGTDPYQLAKALKAFLIGDDLQLPANTRQTMAEDFIRSFDLGTFTPPHLFLQQSEKWQQFLQQYFKPIQTYRKYPIRYVYEGRVFHTVMDLILETRSGLVLIQNSSFSGDSSQWKRKVKELDSWFYLSQLALKDLFGQQEVRTFLHFVLGGAVVEAADGGR